MQSVMKELLVNKSARTSQSVAALTAKTMSAGDPWSGETN